VKQQALNDADILRYPHPILPSKKLKKSIRQVTLFNKKYVLYRDNDGNPVAMPDVCPHRGALLSKGKINAAGELVCAYHAWRIAATGQVTCPSVPKRSCKIPMLRTWDKYGFIWIANADVPDSAFPEFLDPEYELTGAFSSLFKAPLKVVLDNFGEIEHAFQVHKFIGPSENILDTVNFSVKIQEETTLGYLSCKYRKLPFFFGWSIGTKKDDLYHNDWEFKFTPLHGSYYNYWTDKTGKIRRPVSFIVTSFLVPVSEKEVRVQVFLQIKIASRVLRWFAPLLKLFTTLITRYEIEADGTIANFAAENPEDGSRWRLTHLDKQIMANRRLMDSIYFAKEEAKVV